MSAIISFGISGVLIGALLLLKHYEGQRGSALFYTYRDRTDAYVIYCKARAKEYARNEGKQALENARHAVIHAGNTAFHHLALVLEKKLLSLVHFIRGKRELRQRGEASPFLKSVLEHRRNDHKTEGKHPPAHNQHLVS